MDLRATLRGREIAGVSVALPDLVSLFITPRGISEYPNASMESPLVSLETTYIGLTLAGLTSDPVGRF